MRKLLFILLFACTAAHGQLPGLLGIHKPAPLVPGPVSPALYTTVKMSDYGISPSNTPADNTTAMLAMRTALSGRDKPAYRIEIPDGLIRYTDKTWAQGIYNYKIVGTGPNSGLQPNGDRFSYLRTKYYPFSGSSPITGGIRFNSAAAGSTKLYLTNSADADKLFVGQPVFIGGMEGQFYGWPPNLRRFEFKRITGKGSDGGGTYVNIGRWNASEPDGLTFDYNENWKDIMIDQFTPSFLTGKPRIYMLQRLDAPDYIFPQKVIWDSLKLSDWEGDSYRTALVQIADSVLYLNITTVEDSVEKWPTETYYTAFHNNTFLEGIEVDKGNWRVEMYGGSGGGGLAAATGARYLKTVGFNHTNWTDVSPHFLELDNCTWTHTTSNEYTVHYQNEGHTSVKATLRKLTFNAPNVYVGHTNLCHLGEMTLNSSTSVKVVPGEPHNFYVPASGDYGLAKAFSAPHKMRIYRKDGGKFARVADIVDAGANGFKVITTGDVLADGETWEWPRYGYIVDHGGHTVTQWGVPPLGPADMRWRGNLTDNDSSTRTTVWTEKDFKFRSGGAFPFIQMKGTIHQITVNVLTPYVGGNSRLIFAKDAFGNNSSEWVFNVDLTKAGTRRLSPSSATGGLSGETFNPSLLSGWIGAIGYQAQIATQGSELAKFEVRVTWTPYTNQQPPQ